MSTPPSSTTPDAASHTTDPAPTITPEAMDQSGEAPSSAATGESAARKHRIKNAATGEDTSAYIGAKRSKVRGNIRGADKYKGKRTEPWGPKDTTAAASKGGVGAAASPVNGGGDSGEPVVVIDAPPTSTTETLQEASANNASEDKEDRLPKRKVVLLMGYCGTGYQGMQVNPNAKTIEGELFKAMVQAGAVSKENSDDIKKISMMRSARTDKGVHAAGNVVSLKMIVDIEGIIEKINSFLPEQIRLFGYVRTLNSFNAKTLADSRVYEYLLPTYVFIPKSSQPAGSQPKESSKDETKVETTTDSESTTTDQDKPEVAIRETVPEGSMAWEQRVHISTPEEMTEKRKYRIDEATLARVREGFASYVGTHNFHNFTIGHNFKERTCQRYMMSFNVSDPKMIEGTEWLSLKVHGQSFMLHQIRKMVGLIIMLIRTDTPLSLIPKTFEANKINIPKAPSLGLLLERPMFTTYNRKVQSSHQPIGFESYDKEMEAFKEKYIYEGIIKEELEFNRFDEYLQILDAHAVEYNFAYLNKEGIIPEEAIIKRGDTLATVATESDAEHSD
ncbi:tRNA pseudouridine synthase 1 [Lunasporangiospora selenospora]|uniref:tRNA pseudouridine synthase 1 n=1 Tax=Lunasporangiospora selenospora TaxID=979761 RepID=A0A9P6FXT5_9FUNG|nr:tRNA pseudouridine synthase 1 [Lunasporangiospora selenospora]